MKYLLLLILALPGLSHAELISECGEYIVRGVVRMTKNNRQLIVNEKTQSQHVISFTPMEQIKFFGYIDKDVTAKILLNKKFNGTQGVSDKILSVEYRIPDPLKPNDTGFSLDKKTECKKE